MLTTIINLLTSYNYDSLNLNSRKKERFIINKNINVLLNKKIWLKMNSS